MAENLGKVERLETPHRRGKHAELAEVLEAHHGEHHSAENHSSATDAYPEQSLYVRTRAIFE